MHQNGGPVSARMVAQYGPEYSLSAYTKLTIWRDYFFEDFSIPSFSEALLQKSTSTSNLPIFSYNACSLLSASSSGAFVEKISGLRERNSLFQFEIICGWIPKRLDRSLRVSCSFPKFLDHYKVFIN